MFIQIRKPHIISIPSNRYTKKSLGILLDFWWIGYKYLMCPTSYGIQHHYKLKQKDKILKYLRFFFFKFFQISYTWYHSTIVKTSSNNGTSMNPFHAPNDSFVIHTSFVMFFLENHLLLVSTLAWHNTKCTKILYVIFINLYIWRSHVPHIHLTTQISMETRLD